MIRPHDVISSTYRALQIELHARPGGYGGKGRKWAPAVADLVTQLGATSVLDYGCGQGSLKTALDALKPPHVIVREYDPAIPNKSGWPDFADLVVCTDVLEHAEPERLDTILRHLKMLARKAVFAVIATRPSSKTMRDGRNAHLIIEPADWWIARLKAVGFTVSPGPASPLNKPSREISVVLT